MNKTGSRRILSLVIAAVLLLVPSYSAFAEDGEGGSGFQIIVVGEPGQEADGEGTSGEGEGTAAETPQAPPAEPTALTIGISNLEARFFDYNMGSGVRAARFAGASSDNFYDKLDDTQKLIYDTVSEEIVKQLNLGTFTVNFAAKPFVKTYANTTDLNNDFGADLSYSAQKAIDAVLRDYPEIFWVDSWGVGSISATFTGTTATATAFDLTPIIDPAVSNVAGEFSSVMSTVSSIVSTAKNAGSGRYAVLQSAHNQLAAMIDYQIGSGDREHQVNGALIDNKAVCEGYAKSFKLVCDELNIPNVLVSGTGYNDSVANPGGEPHMWNYVRMEDGNWYAVDLTWNDGLNSMEYFLVGSTTPDSQGDAFSVTHVNDNGVFSTADYPGFTYPNLSTTAYSSGGAVNPPDPSVTPGTKGVDFDYTTSPAANAKGWNNTNITVTADNLMPYDQVSTSPTSGFGTSVTISAESDSGSAPLYFSDGTNVVSGVFSYKLDKTAPTYGGYNYNHAAQTLTVYASDSTSGVASIDVVDPDGNPLVATSANTFDTTVLGAHTVTITDNADNVRTVTCTLSEYVSPSSSGGGSSSRSSRRSSGTTVSSASQRSAAASTATRSTSNVASDGSVAQARIVEQVQSADNTVGNAVAVRTRNAATITPATLKAMASAAQGKALVLHADTTVAGSSEVQGRMYVEPAKLTALSADLKLGVYTSADKTGATAKRFANWYANPMAVIRLEQAGSLGTNTQIAAKVDLTGMDTDNLYFYVYDESANTYVRIAEPNYFIDSNGYLHFHTAIGGDIVVSSGVLRLK